MKTMIVKVQVPLASFPPGATEVLIYDERKKYRTLQYVPTRVYKALKGDPKGYFYAMWIDGKGFSIGHRVTDKDW
jgi:hypothetical protein